jgi:tRNA (cmo5U34)-methyltransferase
VLNFTLQFIATHEREEVLTNICSGLNPGGVLILSEKVVFDDEPHQQLMTDLHHNFKRANGYSDLEIAQKRSAIEHYLVPETLDTHRQRLRNAGFSSVDVWFQCFNFASLIAIK